MGKLNRAWRNVLQKLTAHEKYLPLRDLPNGHGHCCLGRHASMATMSGLEGEGYVKHGEHERLPVMGWCITDAGRLALAEHEGEG